MPSRYVDLAMHVNTACESPEIDARACREDLYDGDGCPSVHEVASRINDVRLGGMSDILRQRGDMLLPDQVRLPVALCFLQLMFEDKASSICVYPLFVCFICDDVICCTQDSTKKRGAVIPSTGFLRAYSSISIGPLIGALNRFSENVSAACT